MLHERNDTNKYGQYYWCVKVPECVSKSGEIYLHADYPTYIKSGALCFYKAPSGEPILVLAPGQWYAVYAASELDGSPVAVDHWEGEVVDE